MQRRTFLKDSVLGVGTLAGIHSGVLKLWGEACSQQSAASSGGYGFEGMEEENELTWGTNAVVLKAPWIGSPSVEQMFTDSEHSLVLDRFYRVGGENRPATPTACRVAYNSDSLFVAFHCEEPDMSFPYANLDAKWWPEATWGALHGLPSGTDNWPPYPDEVDLLIQPDPTIPSYYQYAATKQGLKYGCKRVMGSDENKAADKVAAAHDSSVYVSKVEAFEVGVTTESNKWTIVFQIPWRTMCLPLCFVQQVTWVPSTIALPDRLSWLTFISV